MRDSVGRTGRVFYSCCVWLALLAAPGLGAFAEDCNRNGVEDDLDLAAETSMDCDGDGVPDECQLSPVDFTSRELGITVSRYPRAIASTHRNGGFA